YSEAGARAARGAVIAQAFGHRAGRVPVATAVDGLVSTLFHRVLLLDPALAEVGFRQAVGPPGDHRGGGREALAVVIDVLNGRRGGDGGAPVVLYSGEGQQDVAPSWTNNEVPNPTPP